MTPPKRLRLAGKQYTVRALEELPGGADLFGRCESSKCRIDVAVGEDVDPQQVRDSLLHEILHALWAEGPLAGVETLGSALEELVIRDLTPKLLAALRDNRALVRYLTETTD